MSNEVTVSMDDLRLLVRSEVGQLLDEKLGTGQALSVGDFVRKLRTRGITVAESTIRRRCRNKYIRNGKLYYRSIGDILNHTGNGKSLRIYVSELNKF